MPIPLPPELESRIAALAATTHRAPEAVLAELVGAALEEDTAFRAEVQAGLVELDEGKSVAHDAMGQLRATIEPYGARPQ
jgi:predicted transcriptional regulator